MNSFDWIVTVAVNLESDAKLSVIPRSPDATSGTNDSLKQQ